LVRFFVDFLTDPGDLVLDPFAGSNVTGAVCEEAERRWLAWDINPDYVEGSLAHFDEELPQESKKTARRAEKGKRARASR
jgi:site-specific DNA-methyltransferase (cytosine-N4-specific)